MGKAKKLTEVRRWSPAASRCWTGGCHGRAAASRVESTRCDGTVVGRLDWAVSKRKQKNSPIFLALKTMSSINILSLFSFSFLLQSTPRPIPASVAPLSAFIGRRCIGNQMLSSQPLSRQHRTGSRIAPSAGIEQ